MNPDRNGIIIPCINPAATPAFDAVGRRAPPWSPFLFPSSPSSRFRCQEEEAALFWPYLEGVCWRPGCVSVRRRGCRGPGVRSRGPWPCLRMLCRLWRRSWLFRRGLLLLSVCVVSSVCLWGTGLCIID